MPGGTNIRSPPHETVLNGCIPSSATFYDEGKTIGSKQVVIIILETTVVSKFKKVFSGVPFSDAKYQGVASP